MGIIKTRVKMKRLKPAALVLCLALTLLCLVGCGDQKNDQPPKQEISMSSEEYEKLPDETEYNKAGGISTTGKDLVPQTGR